MRSLKWLYTNLAIGMYLSAIIGDIGFSVLVYINHVTFTCTSRTLFTHSTEVVWNINGGAEWAAVEMRNSF